jgi:hypothetical protein
MAKLILFRKKLCQSCNNFIKDNLDELEKLFKNDSTTKDIVVYKIENGEDTVEENKNEVLSVAEGVESVPTLYLFLNNEKSLIDINTRNTTVIFNNIKNKLEELKKLNLGKKYMKYKYKYLKIKNKYLQ